MLGSLYGLERQWQQQRNSNSNSNSNSSAGRVDWPRIKAHTR